MSRVGRRTAVANSSVGVGRVVPVAWQVGTAAAAGNDCTSCRATAGFATESKLDKILLQTYLCKLSSVSYINLFESTVR